MPKTKRHRLDMDYLMSFVQTPTIDQNDHQLNPALAILNTKANHLPAVLVSKYVSQQD
jgi:hypothetical protein